MTLVFAGPFGEIRGAGDIALHWLEAEILPHVLRYFGIATLLDPAVSATIAATGLYLREGNPVEDLGYRTDVKSVGIPDKSRSYWPSWTCGPGMLALKSWWVLLQQRMGPFRKS